MEENKKQQEAEEKSKELLEEGQTGSTFKEKADEEQTAAGRETVGSEISKQEAVEEEETAKEDTLEKQLEEYREKCEEYFDRLLRLQADFENYKKRIAREREQMYQNAASEVLVQFLEVLDNMERAFQSLDINNSDCSNCNSIVEGIRMVIKQFNDILSRFGVEEIPAQGEKFDPSCHYAVMQVEASDVEEGTVVEVIQKGYRTQSRILRPSMVKVAK